MQRKTARAIGVHLANIGPIARLAPFYSTSWRFASITSARLGHLEPGESLVAGALREIMRADLVCVILHAGYRQDDVSFEAGLALGGGRPVLILTEPDVDVPFELRQLLYVRTFLNQD